MLNLMKANYLEDFENFCRVMDIHKVVESLFFSKKPAQIGVLILGIMFLDSSINYKSHIYKLYV